MHIYTLILNTYEFIDKIPEKLQGEKRAKIAENLSKSASNYVGRISETFRYGLFKQNGEKKSAFYTGSKAQKRLPRGLTQISHAAAIFYPLSDLSGHPFCSDNSYAVDPLKRFDLTLYHGGDCGVKRSGSLNQRVCVIAL